MVQEVIYTRRFLENLGFPQHDERCQAGTWAPAIYRNGTQGKSARAMCQYSLLKVLFPFSLNPELYRDRLS